MLDSKLVRDGLNPNYWLSVKRNGTRNIKAHRKEKFNKLVNNIYSFETKKNLRTLLQSKSEELLNCQDVLPIQKAI